MAAGRVGHRRAARDTWDTGWDTDVMVSRPLYRLEADVFKTLGHPSRIRVLELLDDWDRTVAELLATTGIEASNLSQQLAVPRRATLGAARKDGSAIVCAMTNPQIAGLLVPARETLAGLLSGQA